LDIEGPVWLQMLALELANVGRQPRPPSLPNRNKRRRRRAAPSSLYTRRRGLRRASCRGTPREVPRSVRRASRVAALGRSRRTACRHFSRAACLPSACAQRVCTAACSSRRHAAAANSQRSMGASRRKRVPFSFCYTWRPLLNSAICRG
jgi:hypothetical protein